MGLEDRINLRTMNGKTGYKITKFQIIGTVPGAASAEYVAKITKRPDPNIGSGVNFSNNDLLAVIFMNADTNPAYASTQNIIFDTDEFNQDIFVNITDASGGTSPCNYYIELEAFKINDLEATQLTLANIKTITSTPI